MAGALIAIILVMTLIFCVGCYRTGYLEKKEEEEYEREMMARSRRNNNTNNNTHKELSEDEASLRKQVLERLFPVHNTHNNNNGDDTRNNPPLPKDEEEQNCPICLEALVVTSARTVNDTNEEEQLQHPPPSSSLSSSSIIIQGHACRHRYHRTCALNWLLTQSDCPECRQPMWDDRDYQRALADALSNGATATRTDDPTIPVQGATRGTGVAAVEEDGQNNNTLEEQSV